MSSAVLLDAHIPPLHRVIERLATLPVVRALKGPHGRCGGRRGGISKKRAPVFGRQPA